MDGIFTDKKEATNNTGIHQGKVWLQCPITVKMTN